MLHPIIAQNNQLQEQNLKLHSHTLTLCGNSKLIHFGGTDSIEVSNKVHIYDLEENKWIAPTILNQQIMPQGRYKHTAVYNPPNQLILFGGFNGITIFNDLYILDIDIFCWTEVKLKQNIQPPHRYSHLSFLVGEGMYIFAGKGGNENLGDAKNLQDMWIFDIHNKNWNNVMNNVEFPNEVQGENLQGVLSVDDQKFILWTKQMNQIYIFNIQQQKWIQNIAHGICPKERIGSACALFDEHQILIFGGTNNNECFSDCYVLDFQDYADFKWSQIHFRGDKVQQKRMNHTLTSVFQDVFIFGGCVKENSQSISDNSQNKNYFKLQSSSQVCLSNFEAFDPYYIYEWECDPQAGTQPRYRSQFVMLHIKKHQKIIIYGGIGQDGVLKDLLLYDYVRARWVIKEKKEYIPMCCHSGSYDEDTDIIFINGGGNVIESFMNVYIIKPNNNWSWELFVTKDTPNPRIGHASWIHAGNYYSFGGYNPKYGYLNELIFFALPSQWMIEKNTIEAPAWQSKQISQLGKCPEPRCCFSFTILDEYRALIIGGINDQQIFDDIWIFNLYEFTFKQLQIPQNPIQVYGHTVNQLDQSTLLLFGGSSMNKGNGEIIPTDQCIMIELDQNNSSQLAYSNLKIYNNIPARVYHSSIQIEQIIYVFGGTKDSNMYILNTSEDFCKEYNENEQSQSSFIQDSFYDNSFQRQNQSQSQDY